MNGRLKRRKWIIGLPSSFTSNLTSLIQRSYETALIARAASIFGIDTILFYEDPLSKETKDSLRQVIKILRYLNTPPYLRKDLFQLDRDLSYVGILPPLKTPLHKEKERLSELTLPQVRLGLVKREYFGKHIVDVGLDKEVAIKEDGVREGSVIPVLLEKITNTYIWGKRLSYEEVIDMGIYPGYNIVKIKGSVVDYLRKFKGLKIATSRKGILITKVFDELLDRIKKADEILVLFGSHSYGLYEIFNAYNTRPEDCCDYSLNVIPKQHVETVRTEEAVFISLAILKLIEHLALA